MSVGEITELSTKYRFYDAQGTYNELENIDDSHVLNTWTGAGNESFLQVLEYEGAGYTCDPLDATTGASSGNPLQTSEGSDGIHPITKHVTGEYYLSLYINSAGGIYGAVYNIDSSYIITEENSPVLLLRDANRASLTNLELVQMDTYKFVILYYKYDGSNYGIAQTIEINPADWTISLLGSGFEFATTKAHSISAIKKDTNKIILWYSDVYTGTCKCLAVNLTTGAIANSGTGVNYYSSASAQPTYFNAPINTGIGKYIDIFYDGSLNRAVVGNFSVDGSDNVTMVSTETFPEEIDTNMRICESNNGVYAVVGRNLADNDGFMITFGVDGSGYFDTVYDTLKLDNTQFFYPGFITLKNNYVVPTWKGLDNKGYTRAYYIEPETVTTSFLGQII